jgi:hypothetical protein
MLCQLNRVISLLLLVLIVGLVSACATMRLEVEDLIKEGKDAEAARTGLMFLKSPDAYDRPADEIAWIRRAVGEAALRVAMREDSLDAYGGYRKDIPDWPEVIDLKERVVEREARLVFTDIHRNGDDEAAHRRFRETYAGSSFIYRSKQLESGSAYARARGRHSISALRAFRTQYCDWGEAKGVCEQAEIAEGHMALEKAIESGDARKLAQVKSRYRNIEGLALNAQDAEGQIAFNKARKNGTPQAMETFARKYPDHVLANDAIQLALQARLAKAKASGTFQALESFESTYGAQLSQPIQRALRQSQADVAWKEWIEPDPKNVASLKRYVNAFKDLAGMHAGVTHAREALALAGLERAQLLGTQQAYEAYIAEYQDWRPAVDLVKAAKEGIVTIHYVKARRMANWSAWAAFVRKFQSWPEAAELINQARKRAERLGKPLPAASGPVAPTTGGASPNGKRQVAQGPKVTVWRQDSATLGAIVQGLLPNVPRDGDSSEVAATKKKKFDRSLRALNRRWYGKKLSLKAARVTDKRPRLALTKTGKSILRARIKELKSNGWGRLVGKAGDIGLLATNLMGGSLTNCDGCLQENGEIEVALEIPIPTADGGYESVESGILLDVTKLEAADKPLVAGETLSVHVTQVLKGEREAGRLNEGVVQPVKGYVKGIWMAPGQLRIELR